MGNVGLFLSGATLFLNSLMLLGKADKKSVGVFNLFVGFLQIVFPLYLIAISDQNHWTIFHLACVFLFGLTFLFVGIINVTGIDGSGLGWFSLWVAIIAVVYMGIYLIHDHDIINTITWGMWAYLWFLFFLSMAQNKKIDSYIGKIAFVQSWITLTIPSIFSLTGAWKIEYVENIWIFVQVLSIIYFCACTAKMMMANMKRRKQQDITVTL
ncbi:AmiS/UreI family transporter [Bacillus sp. FJAT-49736]|uniref:AmiS/UreI family transporter n=1 Tax=Bacillus sp. FJAT-49736 TaxID=2833582 RepID=UPI001BC90764|nr:AmiS/UreI family transporter [Bacillus sp. FJAT-49736]MBS4174857.1 AmiS/UreI family transporter [Bacillus sp. FJAT-49736]